MQGTRCWGFFSLFSIMCPFAHFYNSVKPPESLQKTPIRFKSNQPTFIINMFSEETAEKLLDAADLDIHLL